MRQHRILIVCHANTSRSVMAEAILLQLLRDRDLEDSFRIESGGIAAYARDGALASLDARLALEDIGIALQSGYCSTDLKRHRDRIAGADLILAMTSEQLTILRESFPEAHGKDARTLKELAGTSGDIEDPAGQDESVFAACRDEIAQSLRAGLPAILRHAHGTT